MDELLSAVDALTTHFEYAKETHPQSGYIATPVHLAYKLRQARKALTETTCLCGRKHD